MPKTVLVVSCVAPPLMNAESILVWKTLNEMSSRFEIKLLAAAFAHHSRVDPEMRLPENVEVFRTPSFKPVNLFLRKLTDKAFGMVFDEEYLWASLARLESVHHFDLIYSRSHPGASHILAYKLKQRTNKPWIAQFSDPWANNPYHTSHTRIRKASDAYWESKVVCHADFLIFPTIEILDMYDHAYPSLNIRSKSAVLPHHYVPELYNRQTRPVAETDESQSAGATQRSVTFGYFGDFYGRRSPEPFVKALQRIAHTTPSLLDRVQVHFYGNIESKFAGVIDRSPLKIHQDKVTYFESLHMMTQSDVLLLIDAPSTTGVNPFLASKLVDYLGTGKRILGITDPKGTAADILRNHGHYVVRPDDTEGIAEAVIQCLTNLQHSAEPPAEFSTRYVVGQLMEILNQLS